MGTPHLNVPNQEIGEATSRASSKTMKTVLIWGRRKGEQEEVEEQAIRPRVNQYAKKMSKNKEEKMKKVAHIKCHIVMN
jgi:hypothetical protein